ncbi:DUF4395 domain-containing protein, partial [Candidatus Thioglobus sp.]|nr:DUF4395 domain-containing protein [Candidatus Thioglobus sp.]
LCLGLLFFEAVFGICVGCKIYNQFHQQKATYCPGDACDLTRARAPIQQLNTMQKVIFTAAIAGLFYLTFADIIQFLIFGE